MTAAPTSKQTGKGGHRLAAAFDAVNTFPALSETVARVQKLTSNENASVVEIAEVVESDTAVAIAVMRAANNGGGPRGRVSNVPDAVEALTPAGIRALAVQLETYEFFQSVGNWDRLPERFRRHALATRHAAERIAELGDVPGRDELATAALLHDIGQLVLTRLYPGYVEILDDRSLTPEQRTQRERRELGIDHTLVGGVLARRWGLPAVIASAIERHHSDEASGLAAAIRLGDLVVHHSYGEIVSGDAMTQMAAACGLDAGASAYVSKGSTLEVIDDAVRAAVEQESFIDPAVGQATTTALTPRQRQVLQHFADGLSTEEVAKRLGLSDETIRTHAKASLARMGARDRTHAVAKALRANLIE